MTLLEIAHEQLRILLELDRLTPQNSDGELSLQTVSEVIELRQKLIDSWPSLPKEAALDPQVAQLLIEIKRLAQKILQRDKAMVSILKTARNHLLKLMKYTGVSPLSTTTRDPTLVRRLA